MADSIPHLRREVQAAFDALLHAAAEPRSRRFIEFESELWTGLLALGRAVVRLFLECQVARPRPVEYRAGGQRYRLTGERQTLALGTRFGKVSFARPVGRRPEAPRAACDVPVDRELGLCSGFSLGVVQGLLRLYAQMAYGTARSTFRDIYEWVPSPRAALRMVDAVGACARPFLEHAALPEDDGEILVLQVDGRGAPMIGVSELARRCQPHLPREEGTTDRQRRRQRRQSRTKPRRTKGEPSKNAKVAIVGVIYTLRQTSSGNEGPIGKRLVATFQSHEALFIWLHHEAVRRGYGKKRTIFMADGSHHIWRLQALYFPDAEVCLDWYHLLEYLWSAGECRHPEGSAELRAWVGHQARRLKRGATQAVLTELLRMRAAIPKTGPGTKGKRKRLDDTIRFYRNHRARLNYRTMREDDLDIGTGAVEGAVRNLVGMRLDGPGMRWGRRRSELILHLRCILLNGQWEEFVRYLATRTNVRLAAHPEPARSHTAKKVA
jgi:hypothetical protein